VESVEPVSTTIISSTEFIRLSKQRSIQRSSFKTIITAVTLSSTIVSEDLINLKSSSIGILFKSIYDSLI